MFNLTKRTMAMAIWTMVLLAVNLSAYAQNEKPVDLNGLWNDSAIEIVQNGQDVEAFVVTSGDWKFRGTFDGKTINGVFHVYFPDIDKIKQCTGGKLDFETELVLDISEDGNTLSGKWKNKTIHTSDCSITFREWEPVTYTRVISEIEVVSVASEYAEKSYFLYGTEHNVTYTATVDWGSNEPDIVRFITQSGVYDVSTSDTTAEKTFNMGNEFFSCSELKVVAVGKNGKQSEEKVFKVNVMAPIPILLPSFVEDEDGFSYKSTVGFSLDLLNLEADAYESIERANADDYTKNVMGLKLPPLFDQSTKFDVKFEPKITTEIKSTGETIFEFEAGSGSLQTERLLKGNVIGLDFSLTPKLQFENKFDCLSDKWIWYKSSIGISGDFEVGPPPWYWIIPFGPVPIPVYAKLKAMVSGEGFINFEMEPEPFQPESGDLDVGIFGRGSVGAGVGEFIGAEGFVKGGGNFIFKFNPNPITDEIKGLVQVGIAVYAIIWKWEPELPFKWEWSTKDSRSRTFAESSLINYTVKPKLISRDYLTKPNYATFRKSARDSENSNTVPVQTIIYPYSDADISGNSGILYAVWLSDNPDRSDVNRTMAVFSEYDGTEWTELNPISDDGTADFHPKVLSFSDNRAFAAWEDTKQSLSDDIQFEDMVEKLEISVSEYDPENQEWINTKRLTDNNYLDRSPKLAGKSSDDVILTWISNESNDIIGSSENPNKLWYSRYINNSWSEPELITEIPYPILRYSTVYDGLNCYVVLSLDADNDITTIEDSELLQISLSSSGGLITQLTNDNTVDDNPQLAIAPDGSIILTWLKGGEISSVADFNMDSRTVLKTDKDGYSSNLADFKLASSSDGKLAMVWAEPSADNSSDLHALFYDFVTDRWGNSRQLTSDAETELRIAASFYGNDTLIALYNRKMLGEDASSDTDLYMVKYAVKESDFLKAGNNYYFPHIASNIGDWETEICVINTGSDKTASGIFKAYDNDGKLVSENIQVTLATHARQEITIGKEFATPEKVGYIVFETDSDEISGYTKFYIQGKYRVGLPIVSRINSGDIYISHIASDSEWWTGIALLNTESSSKELAIEFDNGKTKTVTLPANAHTAFTVRNLFNEEPQPDIHSAVIRNAGGVIGLELFGSADKSGRNYLEGILLEDTLTNQIYYPHIAADSIWWTGIVGYNPSSDSSKITVRPYTKEGNPLTVQNLTITGRGKYVGLVSDLKLPDSTAWFGIESDSPITGFELFGTNDGNQLAGYAGTSGGNKGVFAKLEKDGWTGIAFVNSENSPATVTLTAYNDNGDTIAAKTLNLNPYEKVVNQAEDIFLNQDISDASYIFYSSDKEVVGFQLNGSSDETMLDGLSGM